MKIAIVDSGIHPNHPHVGAVAGGVAIVGNDYLDRLGHGTAIAGAIREKAPDAELYAVKVFDRRLSTNLETILRALDWCVQHQMDVINLSLGAPVGQVPDLPSSLVVTIPNLIPNAIEVLPEESCPREIFHYRDEIFYASPYPRPIPNVPPETIFTACDQLDGIFPPAFAAFETLDEAHRNHLSDTASTRSQ